MWWLDILAVAGLALLWGAVAWMARGCEKLGSARGGRGAAGAAPAPQALSAPLAPAHGGEARPQAAGRRP